ncbi:MAG: acetate--CoA ligase family protein [Deltaproteobacteria bacterium]|nr:acetate--CoA ligase family protein [Deltaproteobacteria bacterium]
MLEPLFAPRSVLIIGVSAAASNFAAIIASNLMRYRFNGEIFLLGRQPGLLYGHRIRTSFDELPDDIDVAVILTPASIVSDLLDQCGRKGIRHAIIQSGGFRELGDKGASLEEKLQEVATRHGIRFVGPNCLGVVVPRSGFAPIFVPLGGVYRPGSVSVAAQSGGVGMGYLYLMASEHVGLARFASMGNKLSLDEADYVRAFAADPDTGVIALYLESIGRGRALYDAIRECPKPVLVQKSNRTSLGQRIAFSHTAALAQNDAVLTAALAQAGAVRVATTRDMIAHIKACTLPPMKGRRVALISRSGGHAVIAADAAADAGLELPEFPPDFLSTISGSYATSVIRRGNPLDLGDLFDFDVYANIMERAAALDTIDAVVFIHEYFSEFGAEQSRRLVPRAEEVAQRHQKPVALVLFADEAETALVKELYSVPFFTSIEDTFQALSSKWRLDTRPAPDVNAARPSLGGAVTAVRKLVARGERVVLGDGASLLAQAGLTVPHAVLVRAAADLPAEQPLPAVAKVVSRCVVHKTEAKGVSLGLADRVELEAAVADLAGRFGPFGEGEGVLVQQMAPAGIEVIVGAVRDPTFGPLVVVGLGGILVEVLRDTVMRLAPVTLDEARAMCRQLRAARVFDGVRGRPPADVEALARIIWTVSHLVAELPEIREVDLNPCLVHERGHGATVVDFRMALGPT